MSFLTLVRGKDASIATDRWVLAPGELQDCERAAQLLAQLQQIHAQTQATLDAEREAARREGLEAGRAEALARIEAQWGAAWDHAAREARHTDEQLRDAVVGLALQVVRRIASHEGPAATVAALARAALADMAPEGPVVLFVHPEVHEAVQATARSRGFAGGAPLEVRADEALGPFDCVFQTPTGELIASLDTQLARVQTGLQRVGRHSVCGQVDLSS